MTEATPQTDRLDSAEYKIRRHRLENLGLKSPGALAIAGMTPLAIMCFFIGRSDPAAIFSTVMFGAGIFLYFLGSTAERMGKLRKELQKAEIHQLTGGYRETAVAPQLVDESQSSFSWSVQLPEGKTTEVTIDRETKARYVVHVDSRLFYDFWVTKSIHHTRWLPSLRSEIRNTATFKANETRLVDNAGNPTDVPTIKITYSRGLTVLSGREEIDFFLASRATSFPIALTDREAAMELSAAAGTQEEPLDIAVPD